MNRLQFLEVSPERRLGALQDAAAKLSVLSAMVEKDFWVSWLLGVLFDDEVLGQHLVFKGGTSLSKVFGVIDRFSEDIDLSLAPSFVGIDEAAFEALGSRTKRDAMLAHMQAKCAECVTRVLAPRLEERITSLLGAPSGGAWLGYQFDEAAHSPVLHFSYPALEPAGFEYLRRSIKLEFGSLTDQRPTGRHAVRPMLMDVFPQAFTDWRCEVTALELARTFWEKATILHAEYHRPGEQAMPDRYARHYSDMVRLLGHSQGAAMLADRASCDRVVDWKSRVFSRKWARYDLARQGSFRLVPPDERIEALAQDYDVMRPMFMSVPMPFAELLDRLGAAESLLNAS